MPSLPAVGTAVGEAVREWVRNDDADRPATGAHRAPGSTLPLEAWLRVGNKRQQLLVGALVALGLMLLVVPMQQLRTDPDVSNIASDRSAAEPQKPAAPPVSQLQKDDRAGEPQDAKPVATTPSAAAPSTPAAKPTASSAPVQAEKIKVPAGTGPHKSFTLTGTSQVALTFDDGPDPEQTPKLLKLLKENDDTKAVFCLVGSQVERHPDIVRQIVDAGHTLCNHTWNHSLTIGKEKAEKIRQDLDRTNAAIRKAVPGAAIPFFRAPGGNFSDRLVETAWADGNMASLYWQVDPSDWNHKNDDKPGEHLIRITKEIKAGVKPGAIILSHDFNQPDTIEAYSTLIPWLLDRYELGIPQIPGTGTGTPSEQPSDPALPTA
jgi:peptidoglycan-N-acetylglucosamine deacetylase